MASIITAGGGLLRVALRLYEAIASAEQSGGQFLLTTSKSQKVYCRPWSSDRLL